MAGTLPLAPQWAVGAWIWDTNCFDKQTCRFWRSFDIPEGSTVAQAKLRITADNGFRLWLDGREVGRGSDWRSLTEYDLTWVLSPGQHVLAVEAFNDRLEGGLLAGLRLNMIDGTTMEIGTDTNWWVVPADERGWERRRKPRAGWHPAVVVGSFGAPPWTTRPLAVVQIAALKPVTLPFWRQGWFQLALLGTSIVAAGLVLHLTARLAWHRHAANLLHRERIRIARDIHDDLGSGLTQLVLSAELARKDCAHNPVLQQALQQLCTRARALATTLDEILWAINSRRDTLRDFVSHTCKHAQNYLEQVGIRCRLDVPTGVPEIPFALPSRRNLFLAVKEALHNAVKHSGAQELLLTIRWNAQQVETVVAENGRGFDPAAVPSDRNGLLNLQQRMAEVGGVCMIQTSPGQGCVVTFRVPFRPSTSRRWFDRWLPERRRADSGTLKIVPRSLAQSEISSSARSS
ncbi:MAG: histidine kinase [Verrucomicrobiota bacterium]|nr:histidine kinase [Limisphaera sp.]MDW8383046.1 histidine kinase [Verrucomicrobiota bacterium]